MFGNVRAYEGCALFRESIAKHSKFRTWYQNMKKEVIKGHQRHETSKFGLMFYLQSVDVEDEIHDVEPKAIETEKSRSSLAIKPVEKHVEPSKITRSESTQTQNDLVSTNNTIRTDETTQITLFRVLTLNYLINLIAFTYAGYMGK